MASTSRFAFVSKEDIENNLKVAVPISTVRKNKWAFNLFKDWLSEWRVRLDGECKVLKEIEEFNFNDLDYCLQYFFCGVRRRDGQRYPPQTMKEIAAGIQSYFNSDIFKENKISIFTQKEFSASKEVLNSQLIQSANAGMAKPKRKAELITIEMEEKLWEHNSLGCSNPRQLLNSLIYFFGMHFSLRASGEHRALEYGDNSQIKLINSSEGEYLQYVERRSKNHTFSLNSCSEPKSTRLYRAVNNERCPVNFYKKYIQHRPEMNGLKGCSAFYLAVIPNPKTKVWYKASPLGVHSIQNVTRSLLSSINESGYFTNTSLRRTSQNRLLQANIPSEIIQKKTGRVSNIADLAYTDTAAFEKKMSNALYGMADRDTEVTMNASSCNTITKEAELVEENIDWEEVTSVCDKAEKQYKMNT